MSRFLIVSLFLFLRRTTAEPFSEGIDFLTSDSPLDDTILAGYDIFATTPDLVDNQDLAIIPASYQADIPDGLEDVYSLDTTNQNVEAMIYDNLDTFIVDDVIIANDCSLNNAETAMKTRRDVIPEWLHVPDWLTWPPKKKTEPGSDICIPQLSKELQCDPGEQSLCCRGRGQWKGDDPVFIVSKCDRCTSPVARFITAKLFGDTSLTNIFHIGKIPGNQIATRSVGKNGAVRLFIL